MSRTRIVIFQLKEIIYTAIFAGLGILLLILLFFMFWPGKEKKTASTASTSAISGASKSTASKNTASDKKSDAPKYIAGIYTSELTLGDAKINLQVTMDEDHIKSVETKNLEKSVETMYPLIKPAVKEISDQLAQNVSPEEVVLSDDSPYTSQLILDAVTNIVNKASIED